MATDTPEPETGISPGPRATTRIVQILRILAELPAGATLSQLAEMCETPKTSLLALLRALTHARYLVHREDGKYILGNEAFRLGAAIVSQRRFPDIAQATMQRIAKEAGETTLIGQLADDRPQMVYISSAESRAAIRFIAGIGERRELYISSGGRVLLAGMTPEAREEYFRTTPFIAKTPFTVTNKREVRKIIKEVSETNLSIAVEQNEVDVLGFAAPIRDATGKVIAALVMGTPTSRGIPQKERFGMLIKQGAIEISQLLGYEKST